MGELTQVKGIGKAMESRLHAGGVFTLLDLILTYPVAYETHQIGRWEDALTGNSVSLSGKIVQAATVAYLRGRLTKTTFDFRTEQRTLTVTIFNREFLRSVLTEGADCVITGRLDPDEIHFTASEVQLRKHFREGILPIYRFPQIGDRVFSRLVLAALPIAQYRLREEIPHFLQVKHDLPDLSSFLRIVHQPQTQTDLAQVTRRIKYEELLRFAVKIACLKRINERTVTIPKAYDIQTVRHFIADLPFELTSDQKTATNEIFMDLKRPRQMMRLLQGDVGSGKTIVAAIAILAVVTAREQVAIMAPTEVLARQHHQSLTRLLSPYGVRTAFLSASVKGKDREEVLFGLKSGTIDLVTGTHSLIQDPIQFHRLGFAVIDEQHRFGVHQRKILREKGWTPDMLFMSATPIPRTLAIAMFGDLDISSIKTMPEGRKPIRTEVCDFSSMERIVGHIRDQVRLGHQAYVVVPLVEETHKTEAADVQATVREFRSLLFSEVQVEGLHGRMSAEEKSRILDAFSDGRVSVLVSTTVVEVGVNVPNATTMVVLDCERFGLSQLHQLRGRVGRGDAPSQCFFVTDEILLGSNRFAVLEQTNDGFLISEEDLRQRGPGEVFGEEQTGIPRFRMANPVTDRDLLEMAFSDAESIMQNSDPVARRMIREAFSEIEETNID